MNDFIDYNIDLEQGYFPVEIELFSELLKELDSNKNTSESIDLYIKTMKTFCYKVILSILLNEGYDRINYANITFCLTNAYRYKIIDNDEIWSRMSLDLLRLQNLRYEELEEEVYTRIPEYIQEFKLVLDNIKKTDYKRSFYLEL